MVLRILTLNFELQQTVFAFVLHLHRNFFAFRLPAAVLVELDLVLGGFLDDFAEVAVNLQLREVGFFVAHRTHPRRPTVC